MVTLLAKTDLVTQFTLPDIHAHVTDPNGFDDAVSSATSTKRGGGGGGGMPLKYIKVGIGFLIDSPSIDSYRVIDSCFTVSTQLTRLPTTREQNKQDKQDNIGLTHSSPPPRQYVQLPAGDHQRGHQ